MVKPPVVQNFECRSSTTDLDSQRESGVQISKVLTIDKTIYMQCYKETCRSALYSIHTNTYSIIDTVLLCNTYIATCTVSYVQTTYNVEYRDSKSN